MYKHITFIYNNYFRKHLLQNIFNSKFIYKETYNKY